VALTKERPQYEAALFQWAASRLVRGTYGTGSGITIKTRGHKPSHGTAVMFGTEVIYAASESSSLPVERMPVVRICGYAL